MYLIINDINESVSLRQPINNKDNTLEIALVECIIVYSFYNVVNEEKITLPDKQDNKSVARLLFIKRYIRFNSHRYRSKQKHRKSIK